MTDTRIVLATAEAGYEQRVRQAFAGSLNGDLQRRPAEITAKGLCDVIDKLVHDAPGVVALGPAASVDELLQLAQHLDTERPEISVLLVAEPSDGLWERALRAGVRDVLSPTAPDVDVRAAFERALEVAQRRRSNLVGTDDDGTARGRVITVLSPKGGSGKSTMSSNLAYGLALHAPGEVVVVDLDLQFGDIASAFRLNPQHTVADAARSNGALDSLTVKSFLTEHASGLWALCGPDSPALGDDISPAAAAAVVRLLAEEFAYVVVDTSAGLTEHTLSVLDVSTDLLLMCAMDVPSVRSLRKVVEALDQLGMTEQKRHFLINRADTKVGLDLHDVEATVGMPVDVTVHSSRSVPLSMNQGSPVMESEPRCQVARQMTQLVDRFVDQPVAAPRPVRLPWKKASR